MASDSDMMTGRCYCAATHFRAASNPITTAICHCSDCRRVTGAAVPAFSAFPIGSVIFTPELDEGLEITSGVRRWFCNRCGSPLAATFDYLPGQIYIPVGVIDMAEELSPEIHCHTAQMLPWVEKINSLPRQKKTARAKLLKDRDQL